MLNLLIYFLVRYLGNTTLDRVLISLVTNGTIISTANVNHKQEKTISKNICDHFLSEEQNGLLNNIEITFIPKTDPLDLERRGKFWRAKLCTLAPLGLNIED